jgi:DNA-binding CsgD family transcriptional regulator
MRGSDLTPKQWRMVQLLAEGHTNAEIAAKVGNRVMVVKNYLRVVYDITGMNNRLELALWYVAVGERLRREYEGIHTTVKQVHAPSR